MDTRERTDGRGPGTGQPQSGRGHRRPWWHATGHGSGHGLMMLVCLPMLAVVAGLVAIGTIAPSGLLFVLPCVSMMFFMSRGRWSGMQ